MFELVSAIASVDPPSFAVGLVWLFAVGMYPIGIMLGSSCSPCCAPPPPCTLCTEGELPDTVTVTFDGLTDKTPGPDLISVGFSACFGGGASAQVTAPGGDPDTDKGPISAVTLTSGGSGYAKLGRVLPTVTASGGSGSGATLTPSLTSSNDACGIPRWSVSSVSVSGGTGYADGDQVTFSVATGDTEEQAATATIHTTRNEPTITASVSGGSGATFSVSVSKNPGTPSTWFVDGITLTGGGTGYPSMGSLTFSKASGDVEESPAGAYFYSGRTTPTLSASASSSGGSGATLSVSLSSSTGWDGRTYWYVSSIGVTDGGTGYAENDLVDVTVTDGEASMYTYFSARVSGVDESGAITEVAVDYGGEYFKNTGVIETVELYYGGSYFNDDGVPASVSVGNGGIYYREDATASPYVATVTVTLSQSLPSAGTGATLSATVESNTSSPNFGKITGLAIDSGGDQYLAWQWRNTKCCGDYYNGLSVVLKRNNAGDNNPCVYSHRMCGVGNLSGATGRIELAYNGPATAPTIAIVSEISDSISSSACNIAFTSTENVGNCSNWTSSNGDPLQFVSSGTATASVTAGGDYDATFRNPGGLSCYICCKGENLYPTEIEATITDTRGYGHDYSGTYVLGVAGLDIGNWGFVGLAANATSSGGGPGYGGPAARVLVQLAACAFESFGGFSEDGYGCDDCHKKCRYTISFQWSDSGNLGSALTSSTWGLQRFCDFPELGVEHCDFCEDTPICSPSGSFNLCDFLNCTTCGQITIDL